MDNHLRRDECPAFFNVLLQLRQASLKQLLLLCIYLSNRMYLLYTLGTELDVASEEIDPLVLEKRTVHERGRDHALLTPKASQHGVGKLGAGVGHAQRGAAGAIFGFNDLIPTE